MHHLEPLSWPAAHPPAPVPAPQPRRALQASLRLVAEYRQGCRQSLPPQELAATARAALELARIEFEVAAARTSCSPGRRAEFAACLYDLDQLVRGLTAGTAMTDSQRLHALDTLLALLVQLDTNSARGLAS